VHFTPKDRSFAYLSLSSTQFISGVVDTGEQFFGGVVDTGDNFLAFWLFLTGINDTGE
jgi:hypothetical protein